MKEPRPDWMVRMLEAIGVVQFAVNQYFFFLGVLFFLRTVEQWLGGGSAVFASSWLTLGLPVLVSAFLTALAIHSRREWRRERERSSTDPA